jgi:hypothetical protein
MNTTATNLYKRIMFITNNTIPYLQTTNVLSSSEKTRRLSSIRDLLSTLQTEYEFMIGLRNPVPATIKPIAL